MAKPNVLVLCTGNSARSQMAEALLRKYGGDFFDVYSAGTDPKGINPLAVQALSEIGVGMAGQRSKHFNEYLGVLPVHTLIVVCHDADNQCPAVWPGIFKRLFWPFEDPAAFQGSQSEQLRKFREIRDQIEARILAWLKEKRAA